MEKILINDLSFAYSDEPEKLIIKDINLEITEQIKHHITRMGATFFLLIKKKLVLIKVVEILL